MCIHSSNAQQTNSISQPIGNDRTLDAAQGLQMDLDAATAIPHHECSINRMQRVLSNAMFATKIDSIDFISENDVLIRTANIKNSLSQHHHNDLLVHSSMLIVKGVGGGECTFNRIEMVEAGRMDCLVSHNDRYNMGLRLSERIDTKPDEFFQHRDTYKIHFPCTGHKLLSDKLNTFSRIAFALGVEGDVLKNTQQIYGGGSDGLYNCNTFVANVLSKASGENVSPAV
ncbi:hypothetical protein PMI22_05251 [Pseudomonas sp. GM21]|jgi:hypothetical protein|uniref:hypothetical protein n=1 Tax=unclassified Pseudomonas TaxID=196821 RepID=UPI000272362C|nr:MULTISPECIES: hypothetical protein [unclassified Pseudomonas]EJM12655.1 hypothetical protein PMI22_05251 [Pseudomonas sp. GM21]MDR6928769.1 hypothetical protein [Pseudomonas sp. BE134]